MKKSILLVDDESDLRLAIKDTLVSNGFDVTEASDGAEGLQKFLTRSFDLVLSDIRMPRMSGFDMLNEIRKRCGSAVPIVLMTGYSEVSAQSAYARGANALFWKPFLRRPLLDTIRSLLLPVQERWTKAPVADVTNLPLLQGSLENLGIGGFFSPMKSEFPEVGTKVRFLITGLGPDVFGVGVVRCVRRHGESGYQAGCGVEFQWVEEGSKELLEKIQSMTTKSYIPIGE